MTQQLDPRAVKQEQQEYWNRAAAGWRKHDERFRQVTAPVSRRLLELAGLSPGMRVLDIASGTGEPALPAAEVVGPGGRVVLTDQSEEMLAVAREKAEARRLTNVEFRVADGEELDAGDGEFDAVLCRWGIMFMPEPVRCLRQARAALKPGGRIAMAVWGPPERNPFFVLPMAVLMKYADVPRPGPGEPGVFAFAERGRLAAAFTEAGFGGTMFDEMELPMAVFDSGHEFWEYLREMGPIARHVAELSGEVQQKVGEEIAAAAGGGDPNGAVRLNGYTVFASAVK